MAIASPPVQPNLSSKFRAYLSETGVTGDRAEQLARKFDLYLAEKDKQQANTIPDDGSGFFGEALKGATKGTLNIAAGALSGAPAVTRYVGEALTGAAAAPFQAYGYIADKLGNPALADTMRRTAEGVAVKGIDLANQAGEGVRNLPATIGVPLTTSELSVLPRGLARTQTLQPSARAAADMQAMGNGTNLLPQTGAGWGAVAGDTAPAMGAGFAAGLLGGPSVGTLVSGSAAGAQEYETYIQQLKQEFPGKSTDFYEGEASRRMLQTTAIESVTERLPMGEILQGKLAKMFMGKAFAQWPKWARALIGQTLKGATSGVSEGLEEVTAEGSGAVGDFASGDPRAFENLPQRMATSGLIGTAMGAGMGGLTPGGFGAPVRPDPTTPPTDRMGGRGPTGPSRPTPETTPPTPETTDTTLDDAAALAEQRLNERYNPAPVGQPSPADQSASSPTEQGNGDAEYEAAIQAIMAQRAERKAARQDTALQDEAIANIMERRNAARAERAAQATAQTAQPPMRRVDRPTAPRVTLDPNAQVPTAPEPRRFTDRLTVPQRAPEGQRQEDAPVAGNVTGGPFPQTTTDPTAPSASTKPQDQQSPSSASMGPSPQSTREPWQMRWDEYKDPREDSQLGDVDAQFEQHSKSVREAFNAGKPVPVEVLADYPELLKWSPSERGQTKRGDLVRVRTTGGGVVVGEYRGHEARKRQEVDAFPPTWVNVGNSSIPESRVIGWEKAALPNPPESPDGSNDSESPKGSMQQGTVTVRDGTAKDVGASRIEEARTLYGGMKRIAGWIFADDSATPALIHPTEDRVVLFSPKAGSGSSLLEARTRAQAFAQDNPVASKPNTPPPGELVVKDIRVQPQPQGQVAATTNQEREKGATQKRAAVGGEYGPNGEWYPGGAFIATTEMPKRTREEIRRAATGKVHVEPGRWEVPEAGTFSILENLGGTFMGPDGRFNDTYAENLIADGVSSEYVDSARALAKAYRQGERFASVLKHPELARVSDLYRMIAKNMPIPGSALDKFAPNIREALQKANPQPQGQVAATTNKEPEKAKQWADAFKKISVLASHRGEYVADDVTNQAEQAIGRQFVPGADRKDAAKVGGFYAAMVKLARTTSAAEQAADTEEFNRFVGEMRAKYAGAASGISEEVRSALASLAKSKTGDVADLPESLWAGPFTSGLLDAWSDAVWEHRTSRWAEDYDKAVPSAMDRSKDAAAKGQAAIRRIDTIKLAWMILDKEGKDPSVLDIDARIDKLHEQADEDEPETTTNKEPTNGEEAPQAERLLKDEEDVFERLGRESDERKKQMREFLDANRGKPFTVHSTEYGATIAFTPSAKHPGEWQVTWFSPRDGKPSGDTRYATWDAAVAAENRFGQLKPETAKVIGTAAPAESSDPRGTGAASASGPASVAFRSMPPKAVRDSLKAAGFSFDKTARVWAGPDTPEAHAVAKRISDERDAYLASKGTKPAEKPAEAKAETAAAPAPAVNKNAELAKKLRALARGREEAATAKLNQDRNTNTARRARMADGQIADARAALAKAQKLAKIADAIEAGNETLAAIRTMSDFEEITHLIAQAKYEAYRSKPNTGIRAEQVEEKITVEDAIPFFSMRVPSLHPAWLRTIVDKARGVRGLKQAAEEVNSRIYGGEDGRVYLGGRLLEALRKIVEKVDAKDVAAEIKSYDRLAAMSGGEGISIDKLQRLAREVEAVTGNVRRAAEDPIKKAERELIGQTVGVDFFPTPKPVADDIISRAGIEPGMKVLEPSAGNGRLADAAKEAGAEVDAVELSPALRNILTLKGHNVAGQDFDEFKPGPVYDRIVMNPPFSDRRDVEHVRRAFDMLKPGGRLVAIMSEGPFFGSDKKATGFRDWLESMGGTSEKLPPNTFMQDKSGLPTTGVNARIVVVEKPSTIPQENADGTGTGSTGGVGTARVNGQGAGTGQQAEDAGVPAKVQAAKRGNEPRFTRADIERRLFKLLEDVGLANTERMNDIASEESAKQSNEQFSTSFSDTTMKGEIERLIEGRPFYRKFFRWNVQNGTGEESLQRLGEDRYLALLEETFSPIKTALSRASQLRGKGPDADMLLWLSERLNNKVLEGKKQPKKKRKMDLPTFDVMKASDLKDGQTFTIDGVNFEVMPDENDDLAAVERGANGEPIDTGEKWVLAGLDDIPTDAGTLGQADNTGEVPDIAPEQVAPEKPKFSDSEGVFGQKTETITGSQTGLFGSAKPIPVEAPKPKPAMWQVGDQIDFTKDKYVGKDLKRKWRVTEVQNEGGKQWVTITATNVTSPRPDQGTVFSFSSDQLEGLGVKPPEAQYRRESALKNMTPEEAQDRYPGIRSGETVTEYEKRMGTTDTPDMFGGSSSTGGDPRSPNYRPDLNDRISDALGRWSVAARSRFDDYWGKMQRGEILGSGIDPLPYLDLAASFAFRALQSGVTSKSGRKLTAFVEGRMADVRAKWPTLNVTTEEMRKNVRKMLAAANDDKTKIIPAYAEARERLEKARTKEAGKTLGDPRAVREAVASATAERPDVASKIIDAVKRGIRQGKEAGIVTAATQIQPLIDRAKRATQASRRAREMDKIEARGAVESVKAEAEARAEERRGIRAEAVRLVQDTPIAGRGKYLSAVANAKTMKDLSVVLGRLRKDLARSVAKSAFTTGQRLSKQFKKLNEERLEIARKALDDIEKGWAAIKEKDISSARAEELAQGMRTAAELITQQVTEQRRADEVRLHGRRIQMKEHRSKMLDALQKKRVLPRPRAGDKPAEANIITRNWRRFYDFRTLMNILDDEFTDQGVFAKFRNALSSKRTAELQKNQEFTDRAEAIVKQHGYKNLADFATRTSGAMGEASMEFIPIELGGRKEIPLGVALDIVTRDPDTKEQMHRGQRFKWHKNDTESFTIDDNKMVQIENALTADQKVLAKKINKLRSDMQFERLDAVRKELTGNHLTRVDEHYPIVRVREGIDAAEAQDFASMGMSQWAIQSLEDAGWWDTRVKNSHPILLGDFFNTQMRSFHRAEMMIQRAQIVKYAKGTVMHDDVISQIQARFGKSVADRLRSVIAEFSGNAAPQSDTMLRKIMSFLARAVTQVNPLTWLRNLSTAIRLPVALVDGKMLGVRKTLMGILKALASPMQTYRILMKHSPDLRHRWSHAGGTLSVMPTDGTANVDTDSHFADAGKATIRQLIYAVRDVRNKKGVRNRSLAKPWTALLDSIKIGNTFDAFGAAAAYHAIRPDAPKDLSPNMQDRWAARRAADIFYQVANTNDMLNSTAVQESARRNTFVASITPFTSDLAKMQNLAFKSLYRGPRAQAYTAGIIAAGVAWSAVVELIGSLITGDDEEEAQRRVVARMRNELIGLVPGGNSMIGPAIDWFFDLKSGRGFRGSGILDTPLTGIVRNFETLVRELTKDEIDPMEASYRVLRMFDLVGSPTGPTAGLIRRAIKNYAE